MALLDDALSELRRTVAALERKLDERTAERDEARAQQTATSEILRAIARSPTDLQPVFEAIVGSAAKVCEAEFSGVARLDDGLLHLVAVHSMSPEETAAFHSLFPRAPARNFVMGRAFADAQPVHSEDVLAEADYDPQTRDVLQSVVKYRSFLGVPILCEGKPIGVIGCGRRAVKPFTAAQIELLKTFADQAAIAIANVQLSGELETRNRDVSEALEQQTATAEVLQVINSSPGDLAPVFDAMLEKALRLCDASFGNLFVFDGTRDRSVAVRGAPEFARWLSERGAVAPATGSLADRMVQGEQIVHISDAADDAAYDSSPTRRAVVEIGGFRTLLGVALRKDKILFGGIVVYRQEVCPFTDKQIALLQNFAAQAVIAMENARLLTETREALERQTATAEVLQVINSSPGDLTPVFGAMLEKATRLCEAAFGILLTYDGERFRHAALRGIPPAYAEFMRQHPPIYGPGSAPGRLASGERLVHVIDMTDTDLYRSGEPNRRAIADLAGARTVVAVALRKDNALLGAIVVFRQEVRPFSEKQLALLENFAAQAVIAMENARLLTETREALEQQTATAEVLQVINSSPGDLAPVFDAILEKAHSLCGAAHGSLQLYGGENLHAVATHAVSEEFAEVLKQGYRADDSPASRALIEGSAHFQIADCTEIDHPVFRNAAELSGIRTVLFVPLRRDDAFLGLISAARLEVRPFTGKQIALLQNFAAQAVIAMENARLLTETREALEQQTATAEVLQVINSSPGDLAPVFDAILEKAMRLCETTFGHLMTWDGERFHRIAFRGMPEDLVEEMRQPMKPVPGSFIDQVVQGKDLICHTDLQEAEAGSVGPGAASLMRFGARARAMVALRKDERLLGTITVYRTEVRPFTEKQIALLQNFAAQAVIAMENARLITETREALEQQQAIAEILQVINRSPGELQPVFDILLEKAMQLCGAAFGILAVLDREQTHTVAARGLGAKPVGGRPGPRIKLARLI